MMLRKASKWLLIFRFFGRDGPKGIPIKTFFAIFTKFVCPELADQIEVESGAGIM